LEDKKKRFNNPINSMKTTERFSNRVANYIKYRPTYPQEILDLFRHEMKLQPSYTFAKSLTVVSFKLADE